MERQARQQGPEEGGGDFGCGRGSRSYRRRDGAGTTAAHGLVRGAVLSQGLRLAVSERPKARSGMLAGLSEQVAQRGRPQAPRPPHQSEIGLPSQLGASQPPDLLAAFGGRLTLGAARPGPLI